MHRSPRKSLFDKLETMSLVREIEARRKWVEDRLVSVDLHPPLMHYASEGLGTRADEERLAAKREAECKAGKEERPAVVESMVEEKKGTVDEEKDHTIASLNLSHRPASHTSNCAISLHWLLDVFLKKHPDIRSRPYTTGAVTYELIKAAVKDRGCRYVDLIEDDTGTAVSSGRSFFFISHGWGRPFAELVDQIIEHFKPENQAIWRPKGASILNSDEIYVWLDIFAINQNKGACQGDDLSQLKEVVEDADQTLMILDREGSVLSRIWCLYEAWHTGKKGKDALKLMAYGVSWEQLEKVFINLDVSKAMATVVEDRDRILADIAADVGLQEMTHQLKDALVNSVVSSVPPDDDDRLWSEDKLELLYRAASLSKIYGRLDESLAMHRRALEGKMFLFPDPIHPSILSSKNSIGYVLQLLGKLEDSERMYREAYDGRDKALGADHKDTITSLSCLASLHKDLGRLDDAELLFEKAVESYERVLGSSHVSTLIAQSQLGECLRLSGKFERSQEIQRSCLEMREKTLGLTHHHTLHSVHRLALVLIESGKIYLAEPYCLRAVEERTKVLGKNHKDTLESVKMMETLELAIKNNR